MTISTETSKVQYLGDAVTTDFAVPFYFFDDSHLSVTTFLGTTVTTLVNGVDYIVTGAGNPAGGEVSTTFAVASGATITIVRDVPVTQETDYIPNDPFPADSHEDALDKLTMICQQLTELMDRAIVLPVWISGASPVFPTPSSEALIGWTTDATALRNWSASDFATVALTEDNVVETFDGDGIIANFSLAQDPGTTNNLRVYVDGIRLEPTTDYVLGYSGGLPRLEFVVAPDADARIMVQYVRALSGSSTPGAGTVTTSTLAVGFVLPVLNGGTGASTAAGARTNLGLGNVAYKDAQNTFTYPQSILSTSSDSNNGLTYAINSRAIYSSPAVYGGASPEHGAVHAWALFGDGVTPVSGINGKYLTPLIGRANDNSDGTGNILWGCVTEAIAGMWYDGASWHYPRNCTVLGGEAAAANFVGDSANTPVIVGWDVVFKNRMDSETAVRNNTGNRFNWNARGLMVSSQARGTDGKYCGWNSGVWFGAYSLDRDETRDWCVGINFDSACWTAGFMTRQPYLYTWRQDTTYFGVIHNTAGPWLEWRAGTDGLGPSYSPATRMQLGMSDGILRAQNGFSVISGGSDLSVIDISSSLGVSRIAKVSSANSVWAAAAPGAVVGKLRIRIDSTDYALEVKAWT